MVEITKEELAVKALELIAEKDPEDEWTFTERLVVVSLARSAMHMLLQQRDKEVAQKADQQRYKIRLREGRYVLEIDQCIHHVSLTAYCDICREGM